MVNISTRDPDAATDETASNPLIPGIVNVQDNNVRLQFFSLCDSLRSVGHVAHYLKIRFGAKESAKCHPSRQRDRQPQEYGGDGLRSGLISGKYAAASRKN